jgi:peroxiredoxin
MKRSTLVLFVVVCLGLVLAYARSHLRSVSNEIEKASPLLFEGPPKHFVTSTMLEASRTMTNVTAPDFRAPATDDNFYEIKELTRTGPVVLVFIKDGCPCSQEAQHFFNILSHEFGKQGRFFGVFDGSVDRARKWASRYHAAFPLLSDPDFRIVREYHAENSAYLALIARGGTIEKLWPGYSVDMLNEAAKCLARLTRVNAKPIDFRDAPTEMTTGCPY